MRNFFHLKFFRTNEVKQTEAEVAPSSSLVEVEVGVEVRVEDWGAGLGLGLGLLFWLGVWVGCWRVKLISSQVVVEVEVCVEVGKY